MAVEVAGSGSAYFTGISVDYASDTSTYPGTPEGVEAADVTWNLAADEDASSLRPTVNSGDRVDWAGIRIDALAGGAKFARSLFKRQWRQNAACRMVGGQFGPRTLEVLDLRGDSCRVADPAVERHVERIAVEIVGNGAAHGIAAQRIELFACHRGKVTVFSAKDAT